MKIEFIQNFINIFKKPAYKKITKRLKMIQTKTQKPIVLFASTYSVLENMQQRPEHLFNKFIEKGYVVVAADKNVCTMFEYSNNLYLMPYKFLKKLIIDKKIPKIILSISTHSTLKNISKYLNDAIKNNHQVIYEHLDDFELISRNKDELKREFIKICENENIIISATADGLYQEAIKYRGNNKNVILLKNAVNVEDFEIEKPQIPPLQLKEIIKKNKPIVGYYGCIVDAWFNYSLLTKVAQLLPNYEFVCIGIKNGTNVEKMFEIDNITYIPKIKYSEIPKYASFFDVAIIPFQKNPITANTSPVKLFEYMSLKKPIISTSISECKNYKSCLIADLPEDFAETIKKAMKLKQDASYQTLLAEEAKQNTWTERINELCDLLNKNRKI